MAGIVGARERDDTGDCGTDDSCARVYPLVLSTTIRGPETRARHPSSWTAASPTFASDRAFLLGQQYPFWLWFSNSPPDMLPMSGFPRRGTSFSDFPYGVHAKTIDAEPRLTGGGGKCHGGRRNKRRAKRKKRFTIKINRNFTRNSTIGSGKFEPSNLIIWSETTLLHYPPPI